VKEKGPKEGNGREEEKGREEKVLRRNMSCFQSSAFRCHSLRCNSHYESNGGFAGGVAVLIFPCDSCWDG
jgi:hypothetical protein